MTNWKQLACAGAVLMAAACGQPASQESNTATTTPAAGDTASSGWISLFDGQSTKGWHNFKTDTVGSAWKVVDGELRLDTAVKKDGRIVGGGNIVTDEVFENFHLQLEWNISPNGNSGIIFLVNEDSTFNEPWKTGPEMQILDNNGHPDAKIVKHRAGDLYDLISSSTEMAKPPGQWNLAEVIVDKGNLTLILNGTEVVKTTLWDDKWKAMVAGSKFKEHPGFGTFQRGHISLQDHNDWVAYRNIRIRRL